MDNTLGTSYVMWDGNKPSPETIKVVTGELNVALEFCNGIYPTIPLNKITKFVEGYNLDSSKIAEKLFGDNGRMHVHIGNEIYFVMTWHRYETTGNTEVVCYATSNYDDHRTPYTAQYTAAEKRQRLSRLNHTLRNLPAYFNGKGHAFACIEAHIKDAGFDYYDFQDMVSMGSSLGDQGRIQAHIGHEVFMTATWYKMPSGRYEIIVYAS